MLGLEALVKVTVRRKRVVNKTLKIRPSKQLVFPYEIDDHPLVVEIQKAKRQKAVRANLPKVSRAKKICLHFRDQPRQRLDGISGRVSRPSPVQEKVEPRNRSGHC